jgi:hypothetical protein
MTRKLNIYSGIEWVNCMLRQKNWPMWFQSEALRERAYQEVKNSTIAYGVFVWLKVGLNIMS